VEESKQVAQSVEQSVQVDPERNSPLAHSAVHFSSTIVYPVPQLVQV
jgi:hypothetical protein